MKRLAVFAKASCLANAVAIGVSFLCRGWPFSTERRKVLAFRARSNQAAAATSSSRAKALLKSAIAAPSKLSTCLRGRRLGQSLWFASFRARRLAAHGDVRGGETALLWPLGR